MLGKLPGLHRCSLLESTCASGTVFRILNNQKKKKKEDLYTRAIFYRNQQEVGPFYTIWEEDLGNRVLDVNYGGQKRSAKALIVVNNVTTHTEEW